MVLSNKKLKQSLRATLVQSLAASVASGNGAKSVDPTNPVPTPQPQSLKELLDSAAPKPRLSKREKRRKILPLLGSDNANSSSNGDNSAEKNVAVVENEGKKKKRKRDRLSPQEEDVKELLDSAAPKPRLSKREKRRNILLLLGSDNANSSSNGDNSAEKKIDDVAVVENEGKKKKRKRDRLSPQEEDGLVKTAQKPKTPQKPKTKKKKNKKRKKAKSDVESTGIVGKENEVGGEQRVTQTNDITQSQTNVDVCTKVYAGGIPFYSTEDDIRSYFESCGTITEVDCMRFPESGKFRGIAIISFKTEAAAKRALALDGGDMGGLFLKIQPYKATRATKTSNFAPEIVAGYNRIYVGNLSWDITEDDLKKFFSDFKISSIRFGTNKETGEFRGYVHVDFSDSLAVTMALKLDQRILCGRPVKISCAVPRKAGTTPSRSEALTEPEGVKVAVEEETVMEAADEEEAVVADTGVNAVSGKIRRRTCYLCGEKGHLSSDCPAPKKGVTPSVPAYKEDAYMDAYEEADTGLSSVSGKIRRRTCYECGEKGHLSSDCPAPKKAPTPSVPAYKEVCAGAYQEAVKEVNTGFSSMDGKIRRRTCYECGEKGHLSSDCPAPQKGGVTPSVPAYKEDTYLGAYKDAYMGTYKEAVKEVDTGLSSMSAKIRRRTCYECGEKGHLSSDCPAPKKAGQTPSVPAYKEEVHREAEKESVKEADTVASSMSGKIRRRTCYECGEKGHLSSDCPKKQSSAPAS